MEIVLLPLLILAGIYIFILKKDQSKITKENLDLLDEIKSYSFTVENRDKAIEEKNCLITLKDIVIKDLTKSCKDKDIEIQLQENKLSEILKTYEPIKAVSDFKDETPKTIKRQYNKKKI